MTEIMPTCECRRFICEPIMEFEDGEPKPSETTRIRFHKNGSGHIDGSDVIEKGVVNCEIKEAGRYKAAIVYKIGAVTMKSITEEFMDMKGWHNDEE